MHSFEPGARSSRHRSLRRTLQVFELYCACYVNTPLYHKHMVSLTDLKHYAGKTKTDLLNNDLSVQVCDATGDDHIFDCRVHSLT